ncbi:hypothetical protein OSB04_026696 [Centaurea solstitialis]|uniref:Leucine-rich repeat-containing N-terminal plant-type domain-containing protein n=1 Tax=Centaurea solstitialis TaxID=347529 RepID=A0AA38SPX5_9ASTR|nr:hypothetical protein OSB04_026696 [Centaurea solstitialis]
MSLKELQSVNLSRNQLTGRIPENIGDLKLLASFDASLNRLSGELPVSLSSLSFLSSFNVSSNNLTGRIPSSTQLQSFNESSFMGNKLCGDPLIESCTVKVHADKDQEEENEGADWGLIISIVSGFIVGFWVVLAPLIVSTTWRIAYFNFLSDMRFMFYGAIRGCCFDASEVNHIMKLVGIQYATIYPVSTYRVRPVHVIALTRCGWDWGGNDWEHSGQWEASEKVAGQLGDEGLQQQVVGEEPRGDQGLGLFSSNLIDSERQALLDFKHDLIDEADRLSSWVAEKKDCCTWTGIVCNNNTGHVHGINLPPNCQVDQVFSTAKERKECAMQRLRGNVSPSLLYLEQLKHLDLSGNDFGGIQVPSFIGSLGNLRHLNLSNSGFVGTIPPQLGNLTKLRILCLGNFYDVYSYELTNMRNTQWLSNLRLLHHLDMSGIDLSNAINWLQVINTLPCLVELHLSRCRLLHIHPHVTILNLTSLSLLDLSQNDFTNSFVPRWIFSLTSLVSLDLSGCNFYGLIPSSIDSFYNLTSLELLQVRRNDFMSSSLVLEGLSSIGGNLLLLDISSCGVSSSALDSLHNLTSLLSLDLSENQLTEMIPKSLINNCNLRHINLRLNQFLNISLISLLEGLFECKASSLESLSLESSGLLGTIPNSIGRLSFLRSFNLDGNLISGPIPYSIGRLSSLEFLGLSSNRLNGSLPDSLGQLSKLKSLYVSFNSLTGVVTETHFAELTRLKELQARDNKLTLRPSLANWIPPFKLLSLSLSSWDLGPQFPPWLLLQEDLELLQISNTMISSALPESFWRSLPNLVHLVMSQNQIQGRFLVIPANLWLIDLSSNKFSGKLPQLLNTSFPAMLDLSNNSFVGSLHHLLCYNGARGLTILNLANNHLSGVIPECWMKWSGLRFLSLENNNLSGGIPKTLGSLSSLASLNMCNNKLSGSLPDSLRNLKSLEMLQLARNELVGRIPAWFGRELSSSLTIVNLRSNHFDGHINDELCYLTALQILDLAHNNLSGTIPRCINNLKALSKKNTTTTSQISIAGLDDVDIIGSASLVIKGREDTYSSILGLVFILDLSSNNFSGSIPHELTSLQALQSLNLSRNQLTGRIPGNIGDLKLLASFDASLNRLSGELPTSFSSLSFLSIFNVSFNNLTGRIPSSTQLQSFNESSFMGNKLCGDPLIESCTVKVHADKDQEEENEGADWGLIISMVSGFIVGFWVVLAPLIVSTTWRSAYFNFLSDMRFMFYCAIRKYCCNIFHK